MTEKGNLLDLETRRRIYRYIQDNPGIHLRGLSRELDMPLGTVEYHLHQMERNQLLSSREEGRFKAFFVAEGMDRRDKDILYYVRQEMPRRIVLHLLEHPGATHTELCDTLPVGASTVSFHLKKLMAAGLVAEEKSGRRKHFRVLDGDRIAAVLIRYRKSFLDDLVDRFARIWLTMEPTAGPVPDDEPPESPAEAPSEMRVEDAAPERDPSNEDRPVAAAPWWRAQARLVAQTLHA
jgi:predicted transcriptional regulator